MTDQARTIGESEGQPGNGMAAMSCAKCGGRLDAMAVAQCPECGTAIELPSLSTRGPARGGALRHKHFRNVWIAAFGSSLGTWMEMVGVQWLMAQATLDRSWIESKLPGAPVMMGYLALAQLGPVLVFGLAGGIIADRVNRKMLLLTTQFGLMLVAMALTVLSAMDRITPGILIWLGAINGVIYTLNVPAWQVLTPRLVPREDLTAAITLNGVQFNLARALGPALGGWLMASTGPVTLFAINTASFLGVLLAIARTPDAPAPPHDGTSAWKQIGEAIAFVARDPAARALVLAITVFAGLATPVLRMLPIVVQEVHHRTERTFGVLLGAMGVGAVLGGLVMGRIPAWYPKHHIIPVSVLGGGLLMMLLSAAPTAELCAAAMVPFGVFWLWAFNAAFAALQLLVDDRMRGRVMGVCNVISFGAMPAGSLACGFIAEGVSGRAGDGPGTQVGLVLLGGVLALYGVVILIWREPRIDGLREGDVGFARRPGLLSGLTASAHRPRGTHEAARRDA